MTAAHGSPLGALAVAAKLTLKVALGSVRDNRALTAHLAQRLYEEETLREDWAKLPANERAVWLQRVHTVIGALVASIGS